MAVLEEVASSSLWLSTKCTDQRIKLGVDRTGASGFGVIGRGRVRGERCPWPGHAAECLESRVVVRGKVVTAVITERFRPGRPHPNGPRVGEGVDEAFAVSVASNCAVSSASCAGSRVPAVPVPCLLSSRSRSVSRSRP